MSLAPFLHVSNESAEYIVQKITRVHVVQVPAMRAHTSVTFEYMFGWFARRHACVTSSFICMGGSFSIVHVQFNVYYTTTRNNIRLDREIARAMIHLF